VEEVVKKEERRGKVMIKRKGYVKQKRRMKWLADRHAIW
jgi:hypothetical protein